MNRTFTLKKWYDDSIFIKDRNEKQYQAKWNNKEELTMNLVEQLKMEIMERYGLEEKDVQVNLNVFVEDKDLGKDILADYDDMYPSKENYFQYSDKCSSVYSKSFHSVCAFMKGDDENGSF